MENWQSVLAKLWAAGILGERTTWSFDTYPTKDGLWVTAKEWAKVSDPRGLLFYGNAGTGKTGLGISIARSMIEWGVGADYYWMVAGHDSIRKAVDTGRMRRRVAPVYFRWWPDLAAEFRKAAKSSGEHDESPDDVSLLQEYKERNELLVLDDIDVGEQSPFKEQILLQFLNMIEEGKALVVTMNKPPDQAIESIGERVADRLMGLFRCVKFAGPTLRGT